MGKIKVIAFYLPQFHPTKENDKWWGKGFTEWTNVAKAKPLYKDHYQPKIPADLGFYDLRLSEVRKEQAELAKRAGVSAFCYWHYWFGNGKQLLDLPLKEVIKLKEPDFPFCLAWANHDWINKHWTTNNEVIIGNSTMLMKQEYPGKQDDIDHFYALLDVFKDERYFKVHNKLLFMVYNYREIPDFKSFKNTWDKLAKKENLPGFFYMTHIYNAEDVDKWEIIKQQGYDAVNLSLHHVPFVVRKNNVFNRIVNKIKRHVSIKPQVVSYKEAISKMCSPAFNNERVYPTIIPNWDHTPRSGRFGRVFQDCTPELFSKHVEEVFNTIKNKKDEDKIVFLKSWNEWGEGNYMEPDLKFGCQFIDALKSVIINYE